MVAIKRLLRKEWFARLIDGLLPVFAALAALVVGAVILLFLDVNPIEAYQALFVGGFGSVNAFAETLVKATPLLLVAIGICISFRGDVINIGGEGQMIVRALLATWVGLTLTGLYGWFVILLAMMAGFLGGAIWGGLASWISSSWRSVAAPWKLTSWFHCTLAPSAGERIATCGARPAPVNGGPPANA